MAIANYTKTCAANTPGNSFLAFTEVDNITSFTTTSGEISAVTVASTKTFHEFKSEIDTVKATMEGSGSTSYFQNNKIEALFGTLSTGLITAKQSLVDAVACGALAITLDNNGIAWLWGYSAKHLFNRPLNKITANFDSGAKPSDEGAAAYTITIEGETSVDAIPFDAANSALIAAGTATYITFN